jgi:fermentation-respiration switch protein FrsA (DUF1100 family)
MTHRLLVTITLLLSGCTSLFFFPMRERVRTPADIGLAYEQVELKTRDDIDIVAWYLPARGEAIGSVLFAHGNAENISTHIGAVYWMPERGFNVLMVDYRGYGGSGGKPSIAGALEDIDTAMRYLLGRSDVNAERIALFGQSLGAALATDYAAYGPHRSRIRALVLDSAFSSYRGIAQEKFASLWITWPLQVPLSWTIDDRFNPLRAIPQVSPTPVLFMHGTGDRIVPPHHSERLFEAAGSPKTLWLFPGARHTEAVTRPEVRDRLTGWLKQALDAP